MLLVGHTSVNARQSRHLCEVRISCKPVAATAKELVQKKLPKKVPKHEKAWCGATISSAQATSIASVLNLCPLLV